MNEESIAFVWIVGSGLAMSSIALVGSILFLLKSSSLKKVLLPLVAFSAGALVGGSLFHLIPASVPNAGPAASAMVWLAAGFTLFFALEQFLHWHHCHRETITCKHPLTYLILVGDGLHNLIGGLAIGGIFLLDVRLGWLAWLAAAAHEVPQELGDYAVLLHGGWSKLQALLFNFVSGLTFLAGGLIAYALGQQVEVTALVPFAAGNFIYIGASDLIPEIKGSTRITAALIHFAALLLGAVFLLGLSHLHHG
jgi:zinc and cadmium transporter